MLLNIGAILTGCLFGLRQLLAYRFKSVRNENVQHPKFTDVPLSFLLAAISPSSFVFTSVTLSLPTRERHTHKIGIRLQATTVNSRRSCSVQRGAVGGYAWLFPIEQDHTIIFLAKGYIFNNCRNAAAANTLHRSSSPYSCSMNAADQAALGRKKAVAAVWSSLLHSTCQNLMAAEAAALVGLADWRYVTSVQRIVAPAEVKTMPPTFLPIWRTQSAEEASGLSLFWCRKIYCFASSSCS